MYKTLDINNNADSITLRNRSTAINVPIEQETIYLVNKMIRCLKTKGKAAGLAAPQIGINKRIIICCFDRKIENLEVMINPTYYIQDEDIEEDWEGCFSVPYTFAKVPRWKTIEVEYYTLQSILIKKQLTAFYARVYQHECDHLDGTLIIDKGTTIKVLQTQKDYKKFLRKINN